jgi:3D (Asp-Asp-Asp) domain-containing protein
MIAEALWLVTSFCPSYECGALDHGRTASGRMAVEGVTIACPPEMAFGTRVAIESVGVRTCEDRGSAIQGRHLDLFFGSLELPDRGRARAARFGTRRLRVRVLSVPGVRARLPEWRAEHAE